MLIEVGQTLSCGCSTGPVEFDVKVLDSAGKEVLGVQCVDTETGLGEGLLADEHGNFSVDPENPQDLKRTTWTGLVVTCRHGKL